MKSVEEATAIRHKILYAFEVAERLSDPVRERSWFLGEHSARATVATRHGLSSASHQSSNVRFSSLIFVTQEIQAIRCKVPSGNSAKLT